MRDFSGSVVKSEAFLLTAGIGISFCEEGRGNNSIYVPLQRLSLSCFLILCSSRCLIAPKEYYLLSRFVRLQENDTLLFY